MKEKANIAMFHSVGFFFSMERFIKCKVKYLTTVMTHAIMYTKLYEA